MELSEVAPPGFGHTKGDKKKGVEKGGTAAAFDRARKEGRFKGSKSDMFAIMWSQKNKGDKPHYKPGTDKKYKKYQEEIQGGISMQDYDPNMKFREYEFIDVIKAEPLKKTISENNYEKLKKKIGSKKMHKEPVIVEGIGDAVKKGVKRHKDAVEKKKIKNRKAVPYAALAAQHEPQGEMVDEDASYRDFTKKAREASARVNKEKQDIQDTNAKSAFNDKVTKGIRFYDKKGSGRMRGGRKHYD